MFYTIQTIYFLKSGDTHYPVTWCPLNNHPHRPIILYHITGRTPDLQCIFGNHLKPGLSRPVGQVCRSNTVLYKCLLSKAEKKNSDIWTNSDYLRRLGPLPSGLLPKSTSSWSSPRAALSPPSRPFHHLLQATVVARHVYAQLLIPHLIIKIMNRTRGNIWISYSQQ